MKIITNFLTIKKILLLILLATLGVILFIFENLTTIQEHIAYSANKPVKPRIPGEKIMRDITIPGDTKTKLDLYNITPKTEKAETLRPVLVVLHGGYWQGGNKKNYGHIAGLASKAGFATVIPGLPQAPGTIGRIFSHSGENIILFQEKSLGELVVWLRQNSANLGLNTEQIHILAAGSAATAAALLCEQAAGRVKTLVLLNPVLPVITGRQKFDRYFIEPALAHLTQEQHKKILDIWQGEFLKKIHIAVLYDEQEPASTSILNENFSRAKMQVNVWQDGRPSPLIGLFRLGRSEEPLTDLLLRFWLENN